MVVLAGAPDGSLVHATLHTNDYYQAVNDLLTAADTREEAINIIAKIRRNLLSGVGL